MSASSAVHSAPPFAVSGPYREGNKKSRRSRWRNDGFSRHMQCRRRCARHERAQTPERLHRSSISREHLECQLTTGRFSDLHPAARFLPIPKYIRTVENIPCGLPIPRSGRSQRRDRRGFSPRSLCISERGAFRTCDHYYYFQRTNPLLPATCARSKKNPEKSRLSQYPYRRQHRQHRQQAYRQRCKEQPDESAILHLH